MTNMSISTKLSVAFLWHMHQPCYKDASTGKYCMPWARLHAVKDYYAMAKLLEGFDNVRVTFNLVPSLLEQLEDYAHNDAFDTFLELTAKDSSSLTEEDKLDILGNFFRVNFKRFIEPNARYTELLMKKGLAAVTDRDARKIASAFSAQDMLDLQVLFNLVWFHSITVDSDKDLKQLFKKDNFTEDDKAYVILKQREVIASIIPLYTRLQAAGRIEISATPFYHPITPLLCDTSIAKVSMPRAPLPKHRFMHPEDALWHISEAVRCHTEMFGQAPRGMWPSEGSVSEEALKLMASCGIRWAATDEDILFNSAVSGLKKRKRMAGIDRRAIYEPYRFGGGSKQLSLVFRDKNLSDIISFNYHEWDQAAAANDLVGHFRNIRAALGPSKQRGIALIAMDGENAWEYFEDNGRAFFETLYAELDEHAELEAVTVSEHLELEPPLKTLKTIFPASWINHDFRIWIGEEQDNLSWDYLSAVRRDLAKFTQRLAKNGENSEALKKAWRELYISEGSDWNWWYGGRAHSGSDNPFDKLYRTHLKNVYKFLGKPAPDFLKISIA
jgi:alpha-amylase/alpha-mannosidase (GH57 family)